MKTIINRIILMTCVYGLLLATTTAQIIPYEASSILNTASAENQLNGSPSIVSDNEQQWMTVWGTQSLENNSAGIVLSRSEGAGKNWTPPATIITTQFQTAPSLATDENGHWMIAWRDAGNISIAHSNDFGGSWSAVSNINTNAAAFYQSEPVLISDKQGVWKVIWAEQDPASFQVLVATSTNNGLNWSAPTAIASYGGNEDDVFRIPQVEMQTNGNGTWVANWVLNRIDRSNFTFLSDRLVQARFEDNSWNSPSDIHECSNIRNLKLANDGDQTWLLVWGEDDNTASAFLKNKIFKSISSDNGRTWSDEHTPILIGQSPDIVHLDAARWGLVRSRRNFTANTGVDFDIVVAYSTDNGANWGDEYLVNSYGDLDEGLDGSPQLNDYSPKIATNSNGAFNITWLKTYIEGQQPKADVAFQLADSSPPFPISVSSDLGAVTSSNTSLSFSWAPFIDEESGNIAYQYAFGDTSNIEKYAPLTSIDLTEPNKAFTPADFPNFTTFFPTNEYVFTIRATNRVGLTRDSSVVVAVSPLKIGEPIPFPDGRTWNDVNRSATSSTPASHAVLLEEEEVFITADYDLDNPLQMNWVFTDGESLTINYKVTPEAFKPQRIIYHTHAANSISRTGAPEVDITSIDGVKIHYNTTIPDTTLDFGLEQTGSIFWQDESEQQRKKLYAREGASQTPTFIILTYEDETEGYLGYEIVELKADEADVPAEIVDIGSRLLPYDTLTGRIEDAEFPATLIRKGLTEELVYKHPVAGAAQEGHLWAIKANNSENNVEVFWRRKGLEDVIWPFQCREYAAPNWPGDPNKYQLFVRDLEADTLGPEVVIPQDLNAQLVYEAEEVIGHAQLNGGAFTTDEDGWALLRFATGPRNNPGLDWTGFEVIRTVNHSDTSFFDLGEPDWNIGTEITDAYHEGPLPGYIHAIEGDKYAPPIYAETGQIFGVNEDKMEVWWTNLSRTMDPEGEQYPAWPSEHRIQWYSKVSRYANIWGETPDSNQMIIARQNGSDVIHSELYGTDWGVYYQNDRNLPGFNPNEEHARVFPYKDGSAIFPLRNDLNNDATSQAYVLMQYREQPTNEKWRFRVFQVVQEKAPYFFKNWEHIAYKETLDGEIDEYEGDAGKKIKAPYPLRVLQYCEETEAVAGPYFEDRKEFHWARAAGNDGGTAEITMRYYYPVQEGFYTADLPEGTRVGTHIPWLDKLSGVPRDVAYTIHWPENVPTMKIGQTVMEASFEIPQIDGQCAVDIIYEQSFVNEERRSVLLVDPVQSRFVPLEAIPDGIKTESKGQEILFPDLSLALRERIFYRPDEQRLYFRGKKINPDYALFNVMSERELQELQALGGGIWASTVQNLYQETKDPIIIQNSSTDPYDVLALTAGLAEGVGYVTLALQNGAQCEDLPISLEIIKVVPELETNSLMVITPSCPFDETLTLRHKGDFGGKADDFEFEWKYIPDENGVFPDTATISTAWFNFNAIPASGKGAIDATLKGPGILTLSDNWFVARYKTPEGSYPWSNQWSEWTQPQLAEGWIKRVVGDVNPFTQRASGGGIEGAENSFFDFGEREINTIVSMISQAGDRWTGNVPLNCDNIDDFGLIEIYETVLGRGVDLSIEGIPPVDYPPANNALLLVASRIADMYTLLGNEAFADAADPTIAFGTEDGVYGAEASSIHCFQNQTADLLEEELSLLRGRDDANAPGVGSHPVYNRLFWNFTQGDGEVAYASNYDIQDQSGIVDGRIDEKDAKQFYPQGHGDAWGHYLTATKTYYKLLRHPNYTWNPRAEGILLGGEPITVDYFDERKFATAAAAKARTASEIVNLTYRAAYVENPEGQWQGYKDGVKDRAWGFSEWADRTGQAAYMDWIVGNAILPAKDLINTGIQKIDRTTVLELRDIASHAIEIQAKVDEANGGLNPLGLATNTIAFDISPAEIDAGKTHFEQIYERAAASMNNAVTVFNHANNSTQLLRRQADNLNDFKQKVEDSEADFNNRLIEVFGYPYSDDIGPGKVYPTGYNGPDIYHYNYVDPSDLQLSTPPNLIEVDAYFKELEIDENGSLKEVDKTVTYHLSNTSDQFGQLRPSSFTGSRRAPGEIQVARAELIQAKGRLDQALIGYDNLIASIESQSDLLQSQYNTNAQEIYILNNQLSSKTSLLNRISRSRQMALEFKTIARVKKLVGDASAELLPLAAGLTIDPTSTVRGAVRLGGAIFHQAFSRLADDESIAELDYKNALELMQEQTNIKLTTSRQEQAFLQQIAQLEEIVRQEPTKRLEIYALVENARQAAGRYLVVLAKGQRLLEDRNRFRRQTAANIQSRRYKDMAFRIFRNDALQKYRAQFDLTARYIYLAAKAYDYETALLSDDGRAGQNFLTDIIRRRSLGTVQNGIPQTGKGLADPMQRMYQNFQVFKGQLGINNPQQETNRFSLRNELFRIPSTVQGNQQWRDSLRNYIVPNIYDLPEFQRYCRPFSVPQASEPAIVIPFSTNITFGLNFFGKELEGGDNAYDASNFSTKIRSAGVWFSNYNNLTGNGMSNTPRAYLVPVGIDIQRSPTDFFGDVRAFKVLDQVIPAPFTGIGNSELNDRSWIPSVDNLTSSFADIRRFSSLRAYHDNGNFNPNEVNRDSRLIGRSVWNTRWLLIIPAGTLHSNRAEGLERFIDGQLFGNRRNGNGISDIKIFFETYAFPGF